MGGAAPADADADALMNGGNALLAAGQTQDAVAAYRAALALRPDHASTLYNLGNALLALDDATAADACYAAALALAPDHVGAHNNRGNALRRLGRVADAAASFRAAVARRPDLCGAHDNHGAALLALHQPARAEQALREAVRLHPGYAPACNNLGGALLAQDRPEEALLWFRRAVALDAGQVQARFGVAMALLALGRLREGFAAYEARWLDPKFRDGVRDYAAPLWDGATPVCGRTVLLHGEQGLGDTIHFARYAPLLRARGARVVLEVQAPLTRLLRPLADLVVTAGDTLPAHDLRLPLLSVAHTLAITLATVPGAVPYLSAATPAWHVRGPGLNVALCLRGSPDHPEDALRSIPASAVLPLLRLPGVTFHVVHRHPHPDDAALAGPRVVLHGPALGDLADTADLLAAMDLVVSADTAVAHLAGALARPVWVLLQYAADFRWLRGRGNSPWYPTMRLFRQGPGRSWADVLRCVADALPGARAGAEAAATARHNTSKTL